MVDANPLARRYELANRLRQLRTDSGRSLEDIASELMCSVAKISRIETAGRGIQPRDVRDLARLYELSDVESDELMKLAADAKQTGWWENFSELDGQVAAYIAMEDAARSIRIVETRIPGLLQTPEFTRAMLPLMRPPGELTPDWIDDTIAVRTRRQARLDGDLQLHAVIDETALARPIGGTDVMRLQVVRLIDDAARENVTIQVIPFERGAHAGMDGNFSCLTFQSRQLEDLVYVEGLLGNFLLNKPNVVSHYREVFDYLSNSVALSPEQSVAWLKSRIAGVPAQKVTGSRKKGTTPNERKG